MTNTARNITVITTTSVGEEPVQLHRVTKRSPEDVALEAWAIGVEELLHPPHDDGNSTTKFVTMDRVYDHLRSRMLLGPDEQLVLVKEPSVTLRLILDGRADDEEAEYVDVHRGDYPDTGSVSIYGPGMVGNMSDRTLGDILLAMNARNDILEFGPDNADAYIEWNGKLREVLGQHCCDKLGIPLIPVEDPRPEPSSPPPLRRQRSYSDSAAVPRTRTPPLPQQEFHGMDDIDSNSGECAL